ncbi:hypothetical protein DIE14_01735 [Burkholderia sp. Bp9017]|uniref:type IV CRISPR-associated DEAD/DEAH-box helicase Csf4 n=1 Tax=unclassified Burkholderia TaxID=2613784 RepID=UPI000F5F7BA4|nr:MULTISPECIES: type IV CRISPR-associated DEAD/DEAH-box helicase Csf4 [unclassified Burkholderia]RQZ31658.1 hypothetical protein DIE14_01735 [Burkholderia sp. Bp9017]RQZ37789.1 hypothetical protein DIE13_01725 [Burkholderia sp. Bp9016]
MSLNMTLAIPAEWLSVSIPEYLTIQHDEDRVRSAVKSLIIDALHRELPIDQATDEHGDRRRIFISLPEPHASALRARAKDHALGTSAFTRALVASGSRQRGAQAAPVTWDESDPMVRVTRALQAIDSGVTIRAEQITVAAMMRNCLADAGIGLIEAGTGVGKTRAMVAAAFDWISARGKRAVIAAPTIALIRQLAAEVALQQRACAEPPCVRLVFGRREFVSARALEAFIADADARRRDVPDVAQARQWLADGGSAVHQHLGVGTRWLAGALEAVAPAFPVDEVRLSDVNAMEDPGYRAYRAQFIVAPDDENEIVLCTHAMLAQDMRIRLRAAGKDEDFRAVDQEIGDELRSLRSGREDTAVARDRLKDLYATRHALFESVTEDNGLLPDYRALIVDEGHLLEQIFSSSLSRYVSLNQCVRHIREYKRHGGRVSGQVIERLEQLVSEISGVGASARRDFVNLSGSDPNIRRLAVLLQRIAECLDEIPAPRKSAEGDPARARSAIQARIAASVIRNATTSAITRAYLRFSPTRHYPQLYVGSGSVESIMRTMWSRLDGAAVVSASLYLKRLNGPSAGYQRMLLGIPEARGIEYPPIHAPWSVAPVAGLWTPGAFAKRLRPPTRADRLADTEYQRAEEGWLDSLAPIIESNHQTAIGGTLVLLTSYKAVDGLARRLSGTTTLLVQAREEYPLRRQAEDFLKLRKAGVRPLWLAVGGAWTGLDIGGHDPWARLFDGGSIAADQDNVLTDLVIPRLPFGTNQSITHLWRAQNRPGIPWDLLEAAFRFKQGLGRLVRRAGLPQNRRIFVLDGRLEDAGADSAYALFRQAMSLYPVKALATE